MKIFHFSSSRDDDDNDKLQINYGKNNHDKNMAADYYVTDCTNNSVEAA